MPDSFKALQAKWKRKKLLDIRRTRNGRWYDQKVTPDVFAMACKVITSHIDKTDRSVFTVRDLWDSEEFAVSMKEYFKKPHPKNPNVNKEYDKFLGQPLRVLESAMLIIKDEKQYFVNGEHRALLGKMADSEQFAAEFLNVYIQEVMRQSGLGGAFQKFFETQINRSFLGLKSKYERFIIQHTDINTKTECRRIFSKVLNIQSYFLGKKGSIQGRISKAPITLSDIRYNRFNFRDARRKKPKHVPRKQIAKDVQVTKVGKPATRSMRRVIRDLKRHHNNMPEIPDCVPANSPKATGQVEAHHIFPRSTYSELERLHENIILLTHTQHRSQAHASDQLHTVNTEYQHYCLECKLASIKRCEDDPNCIFYSFTEFKKMLSLVKILGRDYKELTEDEVRQKLAKHYKASN